MEIIITKDPSLQLQLDYHIHDQWVARFNFQNRIKYILYFIKNIAKGHKT